MFAFSECALFMDFVVPGETGMVLTGAAAGRIHAPLPTLIGAAALGATLGDSFGYWIGRRYGLRVIRRFAWTRRRVEPQVERGRRFFHRHGGKAVFVGRWVGWVRGVVPLVAGIEEMPFRRFLAWNVAASLLWTATLLSASYYFGRRVEDLVSTITLVVAGVVVAGVALWVVVRRRRRNAPRAAADTAVREPRT